MLHFAPLPPSPPPPPHTHTKQTQKRKRKAKKDLFFLSRTKKDIVTRLNLIKVKIVASEDTTKVKARLTY